VTGTIHVGGSPVANPYFDSIPVDFPNGACSQGGADGSFAFLLSPGDYQAVVRGNASSPALGSFAFTVVAGEETALGTFAAAAPTPRRITGTVYFNGAPFFPTGDPVECGPYVLGQPPSGGFLTFAGGLAPDGSFIVPALNTNEVGPLLTVTGVYGGGDFAADPTTLLDDQPLWTLDGITTPVDFETATEGGVVSGTITVNGVPLNDGRLTLNGGPGGQPGFGCTGTSGAFRILVRPGTYIVEVRTSDDVFLGSFNVTVVAGQERGVQLASEPIGAAGGTLATPNNSLELSVPPGALSQTTTTTATETTSSGFEVTTPQGEMTGVSSVLMEPAGLTFATPATLTLAWRDANDDGVIDGTSLLEENLVISKDGTAISALCSADPGCDTVSNRFAVLIAGFSTYVLAAVDDADGDLVPDRFGNNSDNCVFMVNPAQDDTDSDLLGDACETSIHLTDPQQADTDSDTCSDGREVRTILFQPGQGGDRDPLNPWDFYDVNDNRNIDLSDTLLVLAHFGHAYNGGAYQDATDDVLDRVVPDIAKPWRTAEGDNGIDLNDALNNLKSFGHNCL
jgi:hypothetical protein